MGSHSKIARWVNDNLSFREEYRLIFGREAPYGNVHCCFHDNVGTPAAKIYGNRLHCFGACGRSYSVYDLLRLHNPGRLREVALSGVVPEDSFVLSGSVRVSDVFQYKSLSMLPEGLVVGSFGFFEFLSED